MRVHRESAFLCLCLAGAFVQLACGRDGLLADRAVAVEKPGTTKVRRAFLLPNDLRNRWAAYQDGSGPWTPIEPIGQDGHEYELTLSDPSGQFGFALAAGLGPEYAEVVVSFLTVDDCLRGVNMGTSRPTVAHTQDGTISWAVAGLASDEHATVSLGGQTFETKYEWASATGGATRWPSSGDLLTTAGPVDGLPNRMIIRRNLRIVDGMTLPTIDFSSAEAFRLQPAQLTLANAPVAEQTYAGISLITAGGRILMSQWTTTPGSTVPFMTAPAARLVKGDLYEATYMYQSTAGDITVTSFFHSPTGQALAIPALPSGANVRNSGGSGDVRLTAEWPVSEPGAIRYASYAQGPDAMHSKWWQVTVSPSYPAGPVTVPDLRNVAGWNSHWDLSASASTSWTVGTKVSSSPDFSPQDGAREISTDQCGTVVP